ncbi:MAG: hypothetical protein NVV62_07550 [Terricaulis sp.]|nr:hypothetical protein [Terricaulis sp.]
MFSLRDITSRTWILLAATSIIVSAAVVAERLVARAGWDTDLNFYGALFGNLIGLFGLLASGSFAFDLESKKRSIEEEERRISSFLMVDSIVRNHLHLVELFAGFMVGWAEKYNR